MLWDSIFPRIKKGKLIKKEKKMYFDEHMTQVWYSQSHHLWCMFPDYLLLLAIKQDRLGELIFFFTTKKLQSLNSLQMPGRRVIEILPKWQEVLAACCSGFLCFWRVKGCLDWGNIYLNVATGQTLVKVHG